jgi:hypothetical protein
MIKKISIPKDDLIRLYYGEKKSKYKIGDIYGCSFSTVLNIMRSYGLEPLSRSIIQSKYLKNNFKGSKELMAYMIGFRLGDLNVYKTSEKSEVIIVRCHTTNQDQVDIMNELFSPYGRVSINKSLINGSYNINCFLDNSFLFLLPKSDSVPDWIIKNKKAAIAFAAGYIDAEGNIGVYDGRARFKIDSYDKNIILWIFEWFKKNKIFCPEPKMIGEKGYIYNKIKGHKYNKDLWRIRLSESNSLEKFLTIIKPYIKHKKRLNDLNKCLTNIDDRKNK